MTRGGGTSGRFVWILASVSFLFVTGACAANPQEATLKWPPVTNQTKPWTRWWWMGSILSADDLTTEMQGYAGAGLGGLEITPIYGVKGYEDRFIDYLTPQWMEMLEHTLKEGERLDLGIDMATGNGWPFGGPWVGASDACRNAVYQVYELDGGERLDESVTYVQRPMVRAVGRRLDISEIVEPISENRDLQSLALEQVRFEKPLPLQVLMAYSNDGQILELTEKVGEDGTLDWVAPPAHWTLHAVFQGWHGKMVERAGPGGEGNVIDHFSHEVLERYLSRFDRAYIGHDVSGMRAYFNDSYEVDDAAGESNWTPRFFEQFEQRRGYDLRHHLPALFGKDEPEKNARVLCDYRETISDLLLEEFTIPWRRWAESKGATTRNQAHGSPANLLDLYAASGIPETEGTDVLGFKFASSAAHVTGKPLASCEAATWMDEHFTGTLGEAKRWVDRYFLGGINHICYHGTTFSPPGEEWPGWMFYASVHFGPSNSFWNHFSTLNAYVTRCQSFLQTGKPDNDVLVYWPIHDSWSQVGRAMLQHYSAQTPREMQAIAQTLWEAGYSFDYVSDRQLAEVRYDNGVLHTGGVAYKTVVVPACRTIPVATFETLAGMAQQGATIVVQGQLPADVPGWGDLGARRNALEEMISQLDFAETSVSGVQQARLGQGRFLLGDDLDPLLSSAGAARESLVDRGLHFVRRTLAGGKCYFVLNSSDEALDGWVPLQTKAASVGIFEPMQGSAGLAAFRRTGQTSEVYLQLAPGQSCILRTFDAPVEAPRYVYWAAEGTARPVEGTWTVAFTEGGPDLPPAIQTQALGSWTNFGGEAVKTFSGTARYTIHFEKPEGHADGWLLDLGRVCESARVTLNGQVLGTLISAPFLVAIRTDQLEDENVLEVEVSNLMGNRIADLDRRGVNYKRFYNVNFPPRRRENRGSDGYFSAAKWPLQDSGLIGPVTLTPLARRFASDSLSDFSKRLRPMGRILELEDWYVWGTSPIDGPDGRIHVFFSRWPARRRMGGWINSSEIAHAVADRPEGPYENIETIVAPRGEGFWDATTCHNPHIQKVDGKYCLFYMGNSNGKTNTKRIGLAVSDSLAGPWKRCDKPLLETGSEEAWDNHCTSNPAFVRHPNGQYWLYYKSWNSSDYYNSSHPTIRGNRKYGLAIAETLEGPYVKYEYNPVIDYSSRGDNTQIEDAYVFIEDGTFKMIARDMGIFNHEVGLYLASDDGLRWSEPKIAYGPVRQYVKEPPGPRHLRKYGRFERPQILMRDGKPAYLFVASQGGKYMNTTAFVFQITSQ